MSNNKEGSVTIKIISGRNLAPKDKTGFSDPYVITKVIGLDVKKKLKNKTKIIKQCLNPVWNHEVTFPVVDVKKQMLSFTCMDWDMIGRDDFMGELNLTLKEIQDKDNFVKNWYTWDTNEKGEEVSGDVQLEITLVPPPGQEVKKVQEKLLTQEETQQLDKDESEFDKGKENVRDIYDFGEELGRGAFAVVRYATHKKSKRRYAVKIIDKKNLGESHAVSLKREIDIMEKVAHPNIIKLKHVFENEKKYVYLIMELVTGGELFDRIVDKSQYGEKDAAILTRKMVDALRYLHSKGIAHRDLKPENILLANQLSDTDVKLADFGLSRMIDESTMMKTACGTPTYVAPEVLKATGYGPEVDMWSIGVITYILLCGFPPFYGDTIPEMFEQIMSGTFDYPEEYWDTISENAKDFINKLLKVNPKDRLSAEKALEHPWLLNAEEVPNTELGSKLTRRLGKTVVNRKQDTKSQEIGGEFEAN
eukprot:TRINITY_DN786_c0_g1_i1.p1 TRINITY_DN786_c0_g1~~TRINITY_DN786_c0_g1_i1.p1  ORF type:complete len:477 (-),score=152.34 TRINITY_DN786_c0_g1_i1:100-1530(-)